MSETSRRLEFSSWHAKSFRKKNQKEFSFTRRVFFFGVKKRVKKKKTFFQNESLRLYNFLLRQ